MHFLPLWYLLQQESGKCPGEKQVLEQIKINGKRSPQTDVMSLKLKKYIYV